MVTSAVVVVVEVMCCDLEREGSCGHTALLVSCIIRLMCALLFVEVTQTLSNGHTLLYRSCGQYRRWLPADMDTARIPRMSKINNIHTASSRYGLLICHRTPRAQEHSDRAHRSARARKPQNPPVWLPRDNHEED